MTTNTTHVHLSLDREMLKWLDSEYGYSFMSRSMKINILIAKAKEGSKMDVV